MKNLISIAFIFSLLLLVGSCSKNEPLVLKDGLAPVSNSNKMLSSSSTEPDCPITDPENEDDKEVTITDPENEEDKEVN